MLNETQEIKNITKCHKFKDKYYTKSTFSKTANYNKKNRKQFHRKRNS